MVKNCFTNDQTVTVKMVMRLINKYVARYNLILYDWINWMILSAPIVGLYTMVYIKMLYFHRGGGGLWSWSYGTWIFNYMCNQCSSLLKLCMSANPVHGEVYSIQHHVIKFVSDLRRVSGFLCDSDFLHH